MTIKKKNDTDKYFKICVEIQCEHFNFKTSELFIQQGKNSKDRITVIPPCIGQEYLKYFPIPCGKRSLQKAFEDACIKSELMKTKPTVHFHSFRHGFATRWVNQGLNLQQLQGMLGHEDIGTTSIYTHMAKEDGIKAYKEGF